MAKQRAEGGDCRMRNEQLDDLWNALGGLAEAIEANNELLRLLVGTLMGFGAAPDYAAMPEYRKLSGRMEKLAKELGFFEEVPE